MTCRYRDADNAERRPPLVVLLCAALSMLPGCSAESAAPHAAGAPAKRGQVHLPQRKRPADRGPLAFRVDALASLEAKPGSESTFRAGRDRPTLYVSGGSARAAHFPRNACPSSCVSKPWLLPAPVA